MSRPYAGAESARSRGRTLMPAHLRAAAAVAAFAMAMSACAMGRAARSYVSYGYPSRLVGTWVDSALATPTDTVAWVLGARGLDQTLTIHLTTDSTATVARTEHVDGYGYWYVPGGEPEEDTGRVCFRSRARGHDSCFPYALTHVVTANRDRRRLLVSGYAGLHHTRDRVLLER